MSKRIYISGAITGDKDYLEKFTSIEKSLTKRGFKVINPAKLAGIMPSDATHEDYMTVCVSLLHLCDAIYVLKDWVKSEGAKEEIEVAKKLRIKIYYQPITDWREKIFRTFMTR